MPAPPRCQTVESALSASGTAPNDAYVPPTHPFALPTARVELAAPGARPRRDALLIGPGSLTPSESRIAELAATGQSNREVAQALFVTPKTVEYHHLRNTYRKLEAQTRQELAEALSV
jgi:DNA-binding NarL/FixJ family response regulator